MDETLVLSKASLGAKRSWAAGNCAREEHVNGLEIFVTVQWHHASKTKPQALKSNLEKAVLVS